MSGNPVEKWLNDEDAADCAWPCAETSTTAAAMTNNLRPNDLHEIIVAVPPQRLAACSPRQRFAPAEEREIPDRTALVFSLSRKTMIAATDDSDAKRTRPSRRDRIQLCLRHFRWGLEREDQATARARCSV